MSLFKSFANIAAGFTAPFRLQTAHCESSASSSAVAPEADEEVVDFTVYQVLGFRECPWFHRAACIASDLATHPEHEKTVEVSILPVDRSLFGQQLQVLAEILPAAADHNSCPAIVSTFCRRNPNPQPTPENDDAYICDAPSFVGGYTALEKHLQDTYKFRSKKCEVFEQALGSSGACPPPPSVQKQ